MSHFGLDFDLRGYLGVAIVKAILEKSEYTVCHYGYEYTMRDVVSKRAYPKSKSPTGVRLSRSPDLLVYDEKENIMLVEVKTRAKKSRWVKKGEVEIKRYELEELRKYWSDTILVVVVEEGIYAQKISDLEIQQNGNQLLPDFKKFQDIFPHVSSETFSYFEDIALQILQLFNPKKEINKK